VCARILIPRQDFCQEFLNNLVPAAARRDTIRRTHLRSLRMTSSGLGNVLRYLRGTVRPAAAGPVDDAWLLERFLSQRDETAFAALVQRYGSMVLGVARTIVNDGHAAEDVFQATFLVLARKAQGLRKRESLASWLYGVAYRIAHNARVRAARRRKHERRVVSMPSAHCDESNPDLRPLVVEELQRLPEKYRAPLVLCYLQGLTNEQAAEHLHWPSGTVKGRLARAREVLRGRLARRGLALSAVALAAALGATSVSAAVPAPLLATTVRVALPIALGDASLASLRGEAAQLARQALQQTLLARSAAAALVSVALLAGSAGAVWLAQKPAAPPVAAAVEPLTIAAPRLLASFPQDKHYDGQPLPVAFSADGKRIAVLAQRDTEPAELFLQEIAGGARVAALKMERGFRTVAADRGALALVYGSDLDGEIRAEVRDLASLKLVREWKDDKAQVLPVEAFLAGDALLLAGGHAEAAMAPPAGGGGGFGGGGFGGGGFAPFPFGQTGSALGLYDLRGKDKPVVQALADEDTLIAGQVVAAAGKISVFVLLERDGATRLEAFDSLAGKSRKIADKIEASALAASADGKTVALQTAENTLQLWSVAAATAGARLGDGDTTIVAFAFAPDGRILATAGSDRRVKLWDVQSGRVLREIVQARVQRLLFSADGRLLASAAPEEVKIWELQP
jgi:RNA polymerase sigma factor (sigma-70 family)